MGARRRKRTPLQCDKNRRPLHPLAAKVAARRWSVLAPAVALISRDFIWYVPSGITGAAVALLFGDNKPAGDSRGDHGGAWLEHRGRNLDVRHAPNWTQNSAGLHSGINYTVDFNYSADYPGVGAASLPDAGFELPERSRPPLLSSSAALSFAAAGAKIVSGVDDVIWLSPFVTRPSAKQRLRNAATYLCLFFGLTLFSAVLAWAASMLWSMLPSGLIIRGWTMEEFLEVASGALLLVYALNLVRDGRGTCGGLASPDPRLSPASPAPSAAGRTAPTPSRLNQATSPAALSPVAPPAGVAAAYGATEDNNTSIERAPLDEDEDDPDGYYYSDGGGGSGSGGEAGDWSQDLEAADAAADEANPTDGGMAGHRSTHGKCGSGCCSSCCRTGCYLCCFSSRGRMCPRSNAVVDDPSQWSSPVPAPAFSTATAIPRPEVPSQSAHAETSTSRPPSPAAGERRQQDLSARRLVVVALLGGLDDVCVQTLLLLAGSFEVSHMLFGDLIGCSFLLAISCGGVFAHRAKWVVERVPLYPLVIGVLATYTVVCGLIV